MDNALDEMGMIVCRLGGFALVACSPSYANISVPCIAGWTGHTHMHRKPLHQTQLKFSKSRPPFEKIDILTKEYPSDKLDPSIILREIMKIFECTHAGHCASSSVQVKVFRPLIEAPSIAIKCATERQGYIIKFVRSVWPGRWEIKLNNVDTQLILSFNRTNLRTFRNGKIQGETVYPTGMTLDIDHMSQFNWSESTQYLDIVELVYLATSSALLHLKV